MEAQSRVKGYVMGQDMAAGVLTWKVCVTDSSSPFIGEKIFVASVHEDLSELAKGLEVTFFVGAFGGRGGDTYYKAMEVALAKVVPRCDFCKAEAEVLIEVSEYEDRGNSECMRCCLAHIMRAILQGQSSPVIKTKTKLFRCAGVHTPNREWRKMEGVF